MALGSKITSISGSLEPRHGLLFASAVLVILLVYHVCLFIYNIYFHPLSKYPGPRLAAASSLWLAWSYFEGKTPTDMLELHNRYGPVVRTSPDGLSYIKANQWKEIYGHKPGQAEFSKDRKYYSGLKGEQVIINADRDYHEYMRKLFAPSFSEKSMREQEPVFKGLVDVMVRKLKETGEDGRQVVDIAKWFNFLTFDFISFLTFGESFDCLTTSTLHIWIKIFFSFPKTVAYHQIISRLPYLLRLPAAVFLIPPKIIKDARTFEALQMEKVNHRLKTETTVPNFMDNLTEAYKLGKMSLQQLEGNSRILIAAGSETTATTMAGLIYLLLKNPQALEKLTREIRVAFSHPDEITFTSANDCKYLLACIEEALRVYPPSPQPHHRIIPQGGATVDGEFLPEGTSVSIPTYAASNSSVNFARPSEFIPERWMSGAGAEFANDQRDASQPFLVGPRACIGRNLAYAEVKVVIARLVWEFDVELVTDEAWMEKQKVYLVWEKSPLWIKLHPAERSQQA